MNDRELARSIERQIIIDALEGDPALVSCRAMADTLDLLLDEWGYRNNRTRFVKLMFHVGSSISSVCKPAPKTFDDQPVKQFTDEFLDWFDGIIESLQPHQKDMIRKQVYHSDDRDRATKWAKEWGLLPNDYYVCAKETRDQLIAVLSSKLK